MECLRLTTAYLSTNLEERGDVNTSIWNRKVFEPAWPNPTSTIPEATKAMLQSEYGMHAKGAEKLRVNLSTAYGLVMGQCTDYLWSRLERHRNWEVTLNNHNLLALISSIKLLSKITTGTWSTNTYNIPRYSVNSCSSGRATSPTPIKNRISRIRSMYSINTAGGYYLGTV